MSIVRRDTALRWSAVVAGLAVVVATPMLVGAAPVPRSGWSAKQVVDSALRSADVGYTGIAEVDGHLGLPTLPFVSDGVVELDQTTRVRVWWKSPTAWRTDALTTTGQRVEVATSEGTRQFDYEANTVTDRTTTPGPRLPRTSDLLPGNAARTLVAWLGPTDRLSALPARRIGGIAAAGAEIAPTDPRTSVGRLDVWVDPASGLPLELDVYARGSATPTFRSRLLEVSVGAPDADVLAPIFTTDAQWTTDRRDIVGFISTIGSASYPATLGGLPALTGVGLPSGVATYGSGFARVAVLQLPRRLVPRILGAATGTKASLVQVGDAQVAVLGSALLQVAVVVTADGAGYVLAGTITTAAMNTLVRAAVPALATAGSGR